jgi:CO/xanthine dehydrogenase Mo-binding subunit
MSLSVSRRAFLKGTGCLIVGFSAWRPATAQGSAVPSDQLDSWIAIRPDGRVTVYTGKCELGQGLGTAQMQLVAEELVVPLDRITLIQCDTDRTPDQGTTSGSQSHPANFNDANLAQAAATAREALLRMASTRLRLPLEELAVEGGTIRWRTDPLKYVEYGELIGGKTFQLSLDALARRRPASGWRILGTEAPRVEIPDLVTGRFEFVHNVRVPGMLHGRVVRPPAVGAKLVRVNEASVQDLSGLVKGVVKKDFVGVVAEKPWQAIQAAATLQCEWSAGSGLVSQADFYDHLRRQKPTSDRLVVDSRDVEETLSKAARVVSATYRHPYQMHGSVGSSCAVADVRDGKVTL